MSVPFLNSEDTIRGTDVTVTMEVDGKRKNMMKAKNFESKVDIDKDDVPRIGTRVKGKKMQSIEYSGSMNVYYVDSDLRRVMLDYVKTGKWPQIDIIVRNADVSSAAGAQTVIHKGVKFDSMILSKFDAESSALDEDLDFTAEDIEMTEEFTELPGVYL